jgi:multicomponent Na+:H+ antiporter subunit F
MTPDLILDAASLFALAVLVLATLMTVWRAVIGPTLPDRVVALDMLVGIVIGFIAVIALRTGYTLYIDIAIALGLVGFLATVAFARFILARAAGREGLAVNAAASSAGPAKVKSKKSRPTSAETPKSPAAAGKRGK